VRGKNRRAVGSGRNKRGGEGGLPAIAKNGREEGGGEE